MPACLPCSHLASGLEKALCANCHGDGRFCQGRLLQGRAKIFATLNINGKDVPMNAEAFGNYVCSNYRNLNFMWTGQFAHYPDHPVMAEVLGRLKDGLEEVSCEYMDLHE